MRLNELEHWLTAAEAARELGISRQAMQKRLQEGKYSRVVKTHYGYLIAPESIEESTRGDTGDETEIFS